MPEYATKKELEEAGEEIHPQLKITIAAILGTLSDYATTTIGLRYPELRETNPNVNFGKEFLFAETGGVGVYTLSRMFGQKKDLSLVLGLIAPACSFMVAANNVVWIAWAHRKYYPWEECPLLFPEER